MRSRTETEREAESGGLKKEVSTGTREAPGERGGGARALERVINRNIEHVRVKASETIRQKEINIACAAGTGPPCPGSILGRAKWLRR